MSNTKRYVVPTKRTVEPDGTLTEYGLKALRGQAIQTFAGSHRRGANKPDLWSDAMEIKSKRWAKRDYYKGRRRDEKELLDELYLEYIEELETEEPEMENAPIRYWFE